MIITIPQLATFRFENFVRIDRRTQREEKRVVKKGWFGITKEEKIDPPVFEVLLVTRDCTTTASFKTYEQASASFAEWSKAILDAQAADVAAKAALFEAQTKKKK